MKNNPGLRINLNTIALYFKQIHIHAKHPIRNFLIISLIIFFAIMLFIKAYSILFPSYNLYVSKDGSDKNIGTINHPYKTIEKCVQVIDQKFKEKNTEATLLLTSNLEFITLKMV